MKALVCFQDGKFEELDNIAIPINDLAVQRGYGIFDFLRTSGDHALFIDDHLDRFYHSAASMHLKVDYSKEEIRHIVKQIISQNGLPSSGIKLLLTGGDATDGYTISQPRFSIFQQPLQPPSDSIEEKGIHLLTRAYQRQLPDVKTTDYLMAIWLQPWLKERGGDDLLYYNEHSITECPRSNIFIVTHNNTLVTPKINLLWGITRKKIIELAEVMGLVVEQRSIHLDELKKAKEVFICSSTKRIMPVEKIDHAYTFTVSDNLITRQLWNAFVDVENSIYQSAKP